MSPENPLTHNASSRPPNISELRRIVREQPIPFIPSNEVTYKATHSGGKGGQHVNRVASAVRILWSIQGSHVLTEEQKAFLLESKAILERMDSDQTFLCIRCDDTRSQNDNKRLAMDRLNELVRSVLTINQERKPTEPTHGSTQRRLESKARDAKRKRERGHGPGRGWDE